MIKIKTERPEFKYIEIIVDDDINQNSVEALLELLEARIKDWGEVNLLEEVKGIGKVELASFWKDLRFGIKNIKKIPRIAIVTDLYWVKSVSNFLDSIVSIKVEVFRGNELDKARAWLVNGDAESTSTGQPPRGP